MRKLVFFIVSVLMISASSCSIEKRTYRKGYHVEWHHKKEIEQNCQVDLQTSETAGNKQQVQKEQTVVMVKDSLVPSTVVDSPNEHISQEKSFEERLSKQPKQKIRFDAFPVFGQRIYSVDENGQILEDEEKRKTDGFAIASMVIGIVGWFVPAALGLVMCILATIFARIAWHRIRKNPDLKGKGMAITGFVLGTVGMLIALILIANA
jgi:hypothetical protein